MIHIVPTDDTIEHRPDGTCCNPHVDEDGLVIHHSADKREQYERSGVVGKPWEIWEASP